MIMMLSSSREIHSKTTIARSSKELGQDKRNHSLAIQCIRSSTYGLLSSHSISCLKGSKEHSLSLEIYYYWIRMLNAFCSLVMN